MTGSKYEISRRGFLATSASGVALLAASGGIGVARAESVTLTIATPGGNFGDAFNTAAFAPYAAKNPGIKIVLDSPDDPSKLRAMVDAGAVTWDLATTSSDFGLDEDAQWLEPIDYTVVDKNVFLPGFASTYRVGNTVEGIVIAYRTDVYGDKKPTSIADFFDIEKFPGKRGVQKYSPGGILEWALVADGVDPKALYPLDVERALKKLDTIKEEIVWWETGAQSAQLLTSNETPMSFVWPGRGISAAESAPVAMCWDQWTHLGGFYVIPKGAPNKDAAMKALAYFTSAEAQSRISTLLPYGAANKDAQVVDSPYAGNLTTEHFATGFDLDFTWWAKNREAVDVRFQEWLLI